MWQQIFAWSKKIHSILMWLVIALGVFMMFSGWVMHRELEGDWLPNFVDTWLLRQWHNAVSQWFLIVLLGQMATGLGMWLAPRMIRRSRQMT